MEYNDTNLLALYAQGLSHSQIGTQLGKNRAVVSGRLGRIRKKTPHLLPVRTNNLPGPMPKKKIVVKQSNKYSFSFKQGQKLTKSEMQAMLKEAVENTK